MKTIIYLLFLSFFYTTSSQSVRFYVVRQWKYLNFTWPDEDTLQTATAKGEYIPENIIPAGIKYHDDYFYITLPRMKNGVPATLTRIKAGQVQDASPNLEPFPSWAMNNPEDCNNLQNVQNIEIDAKGQMWIIDGGRVQTLTQPVVKCEPKLIVYDIKMDRVITVYQFPEDVAAKNGSFLYDLVVDNTDAGYAYITDNSANDPGIIVYSVKENRSWKIRDSKSMKADPSATNFTVNEVPITWPINVAAIALGPKIHTSNDKVTINEDREVYFCPLSSLHLYSVNTTALRDEKSSNIEIKDVGLKASQTVGMVMDNQGILYYGLLENNGIGRWDSHTPFTSGQRLIARDKKYLEWPNSFTFDRRGNLTVLMNRLNQFINKKLDLNEYNFRMISSFVGGASYVFDDNFHYQAHDESSYEPETSSEPQPEPQSHDQHDQIQYQHDQKQIYHDPVVYQHDQHQNDDQYHDHTQEHQPHRQTMNQTSTTNPTVVHVPVGSASKCLISSLMVILSIFVIVA